MIEIHSHREASRLKNRGEALSPFSIIADELAKVNALMEREMSGSNEAVRGLVEHIGLGSGKLLRPAMVLLSGLASGS